MSSGIKLSVCRWACISSCVRSDVLYVVLRGQVQQCSVRRSPSSPSHRLSALATPRWQSRLLCRVSVGQGPISVDLNAWASAAVIGSRSALVRWIDLLTWLITHVSQLLLQAQGDHLLLKPGNIWIFISFQKTGRILTESRGSFR